MFRRLVIVDIGLRNPSPTWSGTRPYKWCQSHSEKVLGFAEVDNVEDDSLIFMNILNCEIEPKSKKVKEGLRNKLQR